MNPLSLPALLNRLDLLEAEVQQLRILASAVALPSRDHTVQAPRWFVILGVDGAARVFPFDSLDDAKSQYERLKSGWSDVYLTCTVTQERSQEETLPSSALTTVSQSLVPSWAGMDDFGGSDFEPFELKGRE